MIHLFNIKKRKKIPHKIFKIRFRIVEEFHFLFYKVLEKQPNECFKTFFFSISIQSIDKTKQKVLILLKISLFTFRRHMFYCFLFLLYKLVYKNK